jgi:hypothetical protein
MANRSAQVDGMSRLAYYSLSDRDIPVRDGQRPIRHKVHYGSIMETQAKITTYCTPWCPDYRQTIAANNCTTLLQVERTKLRDFAFVIPQKMATFCPPRTKIGPQKHELSTA